MGMLHLERHEPDDNAGDLDPDERSQILWVAVNYHRRHRTRPDVATARALMAECAAIQAIATLPQTLLRLANTIKALERWHRNAVPAPGVHDVRDARVR